MVRGLDLFISHFKGMEDDLMEFIETLPPESKDWEAIQNSLDNIPLPEPLILIQRIKDIFGLNK